LSVFSFAVSVAAFVIVLMTTKAASAWDGPDLWFQSAIGGPGGAKGPGGDGLIATGGPLDHNVTCAHCHSKGDGKQNYGTIGANVTFNPPIGAAYKKGQSYQVTVALTNEHLATPCTMGDPEYNKNTNGFAATFEDDSGRVAGSLKAAYGDADSCPSTVPDGLNPTVYTYGDCHAVMGTEKDNSPTWTFTWVAPNSGANVTMYYGVVDGDCMMDSMGDDVKVGTVKLGAGIAMARHLPTNSIDDPRMYGRSLAGFALVPVVGLIATFRRRRRHGRLF
jgi:hypothetical protein